MKNSSEKSWKYSRQRNGTT